MNTSYQRSFLFMLMLALPLSAFALQGKGGEKLTTSPTTPSSPKKEPSPKLKGKGKASSSKSVVVNPSAPPASSTWAELIVSTGLAGCSIILDGETKGATNGAGVLKLSSIKPGEHLIIIRKDGYHEEKQTINLFAGKSDALEIKLKLLPPKRSVPEAIAKAEEDYRNEKYKDVIEICLEVLKAQSDHPRGNLLLGQSYYIYGDAETAITYLSKAFLLGETITIPIKHHNVSKLGILKGGGDELRLGFLILRKGAFEFHCKDNPEKDFIVSSDKIIEIKNESHKEGRIYVKVKIPKGKKESEENYNFHVYLAQIKRNSIGKEGVVCDSPGCTPMVNTLHKLLQQIK
jgi:tetratricopeptide (TPR) repeat protein